MNKALFLDRDGVINKEKNHLYKIEDFEFIDGVFETCKKYSDEGFLIIVITNQAGIAKGKYGEKDFSKLTEWMIKYFKEKNIIITKVYHCPHHPDYSGICSCRKPKSGMLLSAKKEFDINMAKSILIGDKESDIEAGINAGVGKNILVRSGHKVDENNSKADYIINSIKELK